jgi:hypothetical protein
MSEYEDPFDLDALRSAPLQDLDVERDLTTVPVRRPSRTEFFRVHPDPEFQVDAFLLEWESDLGRALYWVTPLLREELAGDLRPVRLFTCMTRRGTTLLWPAKLPLAEMADGGSAWNRSALDGAERAKKFWLKLTGNRELGAYEITIAQGDFGEPQWREKSFKELLQIAFREKLILTTEHPVIRQLRGEE